MSLLLVGRVWRPHGVRGEVKVYPETDDPARFDELEVVFVGDDEETAVSYDVEAVRYQLGKRGTTVVLRLAGIDSREGADGLRKQAVFAREEDLPPLDEGEYFLHDLIGLEVVTEEDERIGRVTDVLGLPAHDTLVVGRDGADEVLIPVVEEFVVEVDVEGGRVVVRPVEGLIE